MCAFLNLHVWRCTLLQVPHLVWFLIHLQILSILLLSKVRVLCAEQVSWYSLFQRQIHGINVGRDHCKAFLFPPKGMCTVQCHADVHKRLLKGPSRSSLVACGQPVRPALPRLVPVSSVFSLCTLFLHDVFDSQNFHHHLHSVGISHPSCSLVALLVHSHLRLCCFLCCCPELSEIDVDFPVLPFQSVPLSPCTYCSRVWQSVPLLSICITSLCFSWW